jgi:oligopeptide transport system permease protein
MADTFAEEIDFDHRSFWSDAARRFVQNRLAVTGLVIVGFVLFLAIFADILAPFPYDHAYFDKVLLEPFQHPDHPLGTDEVGRDYLSRLIYGARTSMTVSLLVQAIALLIGVPVGALAGYLGGKFDFVITRIIDVMTAFPGLLFAILIISVLEGGLPTIIVALSITGWIGIARLTRAQFLSLREQEYALAARALGVPARKIIFRDLLLNALTPLLVAVSFGIPGTIFAEAGLSFIGLGINDPLASWGKMVGVSNAYVRVYWHLALFPTIAIALTMLGFSFLGDGLRDALDPKHENQ